MVKEDEVASFRSRDIKSTAGVKNQIFRDRKPLSNVGAAMNLL